MFKLAISISAAIALAAAVVAPLAHAQFGFSGADGGAFNFGGQPTAQPDPTAQGAGGGGVQMPDYLYNDGETYWMHAKGDGKAMAGYNCGLDEGAPYYGGLPAGVPSGQIVAPVPAPYFVGTLPICFNGKIPNEWKVKIAWKYTIKALSGKPYYFEKAAKYFAKACAYGYYGPEFWLDIGIPPYILV